MNKIVKGIMVLSLVVFAAGCESTGENTKKGAGLGALMGAAAGGIIGHQGGHGWEGALIGGASGAVLGGVVGNNADQNARYVNENQLTVVQIVDMAAKGVPDDAVIAEIDRTHSVYGLTSETISYLKNNKVSDKVVDYMLAVKK